MYLHQFICFCTAHPRTWHTYMQTTLRVTSVIIVCFYAISIPYVECFMVVLWYLIKTCKAGLVGCKAGLVLSVNRILRAALTKFRVYVCVCNYSSQATEPICIKIIPANRASYADCYRLLRFEIFTNMINIVPESAVRCTGISSPMAAYYVTSSS